jgi:putative FmdB family regulatory protein
MPTYDYVCRECGHSVEVMHAVHAAGPDACPNCGGPLRKAISPPAIVFKGSGWAKKERASAANKASPKADSDSDGAAAKPAETTPGATAGSSETTAAS